MAILLYMDHQVQSAITDGLRGRGVDVLTAREDENTRTADPVLLDRATELERVLFTRDRNFLAEGVRRQRDGTFFCGIVFAHQSRVSIGQCIEDPHAIVEVEDLENLIGRVTYLPL